MAVGCGAKCAKALLIIFNIIFWLSGCAILGVGIWMRVDPNVLNSLKVFNVDPSDSLVEYAAYLFIALGAFVFLVGFLGCCGAIKENKCMLGLYIFLLFLVMAGELAAGIIALIYKDRVVDTAADILMTKLQADQIFANSSTDTKVVFTGFGLLMSGFQVELKCCGVHNYTDYAGSAYDRMRTSDGPYPPTCCVLKNGTEFKDGMNLKDSILDINKCYAPEKDNRYIHTKGCQTNLEELFTQNALILIGLGIGIGCLEIFGFIFAICLCRNAGEEED